LSNHTKVVEDSESKVAEEKGQPNNEKELISFDHLLLLLLESVS